MFSVIASVRRLISRQRVEASSGKLFVFGEGGWMQQLDLKLSLHDFMPKIVNRCLHFEVQ